MASTYSVGLVGESRYQPAVRASREGERVRLYREPDNPHDPDAIVAVNARGQIIGYIPADSWLQRVIHEEQKGVTASVAMVTGGTADKPSRGVVLEVELEGASVPARAFRKPEPFRLSPIADLMAPAEEAGWLKIAIYGAVTILLLEALF